MYVYTCVVDVGQFVKSWDLTEMKVELDQKQRCGMFL